MSEETVKTDDDLPTADDVPASVALDVDQVVTDVAPPSDEPAEAVADETTEAVADQPAEAVADQPAAESTVEPDVEPAAEPATGDAPLDTPAHEAAAEADTAHTLTAAPDEAEPAPGDVEAAPDTPAPADPAPDSAEAADPAPDTAAPADPAPRPTPRPGPKPRPAPRPTTRGQQPTARGARAEARRGARSVEAPVVQASDPTPWGRVAEDGTVFVTTADGERPVGSYPGASPEEAMAYFGRKYDELVAQVVLAEQRLTVPDVPIKDVSRALDAVRGTLPEAAVVGDLAGLQARIDAVDAVLAERRKETERLRRAAKEEARVARAALVEEAEGIAGTEPSRMQWKAAGERMGVLFEEWKTAQRSGPRVDKLIEDELWTRFSHARTAFDRARRHHFAQLNSQHSEAKGVKEGLVAEAEKLSASTSWGETAAAYRGLMDRWKAAGRASRREDDALWARFRAAQDVFFAARNADLASEDAEFAGNLTVKEGLLAEAEALLPVTDLAAAKAVLRAVQDRWEEVGKVPRADLGRIERRMRAVEEAVKNRDDERWKRSNPEGKARAEGALGQLEQSIAGLEKDLAVARERGDQRRVTQTEDALAARRAWLEQVRRAAQDFA